MKRFYTFVLLIIFSSFGSSAEKHEIVLQSANTIADVFEENTFVRHITPHLVDIARNGHLLPAETKNKLEALGFDFSGEYVTKVSAQTDYFFDSEHFRFHYDLEGFHSVDNTDSDGDTVPDYIETMVAVFEEVYDKYVNELGYTPPPSDEGVGGSEHYDIYLRQTNAYGYTNWGAYVGDNKNSVAKEVNAYASNMVMRNNYDGAAFAHNTELENIQVTAAHEFFHAIQFGHNGDEDIWVMEATATFMEDVHYDNVNDCYQYLIPWFEKPHISLTNTFGFIPYGSFIFIKYIDEHLGGHDVVRNFWELSSYSEAEEGKSIQTIDRALNNFGHSFEQALSNMSLANCILSSDRSAGQYAYEEAEDYKAYQEYSYFDTVSIKLGIADTLDFSKNIPINVSSYNLQEYASQYLRINTNSPIKISLRNAPGESASLEHLSLFTVQKTTSGNYHIQSGAVQNIDPRNNTDWIMAVIVSNLNQNGDYNYQINISDGIADSNLDFKILNQYPNPFNSTATISMRIISPQQIDVIVYDILGRKVTELYDGYLTEGTHNLQWNGTSADGTKVSSGTYYITAKSNNRQEWKKITLIK